MYCLICPSQEIYSHLFECSYFQLSENISRPLLGLLKKMGEEIPKPLVDGIFVPLVMSTDQSKYYSSCNQSKLMIIIPDNYYV